MLDWTEQNPDTAKEPFVITELAAGHGQFSFYFMKNMSKYHEILEKKHIKILYIITDIA